MVMVDDVKLLLESKNNRHRMPFKEIKLPFLRMHAPRFALFFNLAHSNGYLRWAQSHYWHGLENGIAYKDHDELLRLWIVSAQTSTVEEVGCEFNHRSLSGQPMSEMGVRREKAALSSGCKSHPATAPAGSNRSSHGGNEVAEASGYGPAFKPSASFGKAFGRNAEVSNRTREIWPSGIIGGLRETKAMGGLGPRPP